MAVVCDGDRRAAELKGFSPCWGHRAGLEVVKGIAQFCRQCEIRSLTVWLWSTENWEREKAQVEFIMKLAQGTLGDTGFLDELCKNQVRFTHLGRKDRLSSLVREGLADWEQRTEAFDRYRFNVAIDYGGLDETARAFLTMLESIREGSLDPQAILANPQIILGFLDTAGQAVPDLVVRAGVKEGEIPHTSGFMPLQTAYSGWVFLPDLFPDLTPQDLLSPISQFLKYERRFGR